MQIHQNELHELRKETDDKRIVLAIGAFDLFHAGHIDYLRWARWLSGAGGLVVAMVRTDERVEAQKGRHRPVITQDERSYIVDNSKPVDITFLGTERSLSQKTSLYAAAALMPDVVAIGDGWRNEEEQWRSILPNAEVATAPFPHRQATSDIINKIRALEE